MSAVIEAIEATLARIDAASKAADGHPVRLLLAVKTVDNARIREALSSATTLIGHNRAQEMKVAEPELTDLVHESHFIGHLQTNKVGQVLTWADCVESVDSTRLIAKLDRAAAARGRDLDVFIQVNTSGEQSKDGAEIEDVPELVAAAAESEHLRLKGFMTIGANTSDDEKVRASYDRLTQIRDETLASGLPGTETATELSMGMSRDLEIAIAAGATIVRVGRGVFGERPTADQAR